jgi:hypothetical protein
MLIKVLNIHHHPKAMVFIAIFASVGAFMVFRSFAATGNVAPTLSLNSSTNLITWASDPSSTGFKSAISNGPRTDASRTTTYQELGNVASWSPVPQCGQTVYYGLASEGTNGILWSTNEVSITWPACQSTSMAVGLNAGWGQTSANDMKGLLNFERMDSESVGGTEFPNVYNAVGVKIDVDFSGPYSSNGVSGLNASTRAPTQIC